MKEHRLETLAPILDEALFYHSVFPERKLLPSSLSMLYIRKSFQKFFFAYCKKIFYDDKR